MFKDLLGRSEPLHETAEIDPKRDLAVLLYTGGTTGPPKGVMLSHYNLVANTMQLSEWIKPVAKEGEERVIALLPFFHVYGQVVYLILSLTLGFTLIVLPKFDIRNLLESIMKYKATMFIGVPYIYNVVATYEETNKYDLSSLKFCVCAADTLHQEIVDRWRRNVSVVEIYEGYGLTEMSPAVMVNPIGGKNKIGSMGIPIPSIDAAVVNPDTLEPMGVGEVGELITRGPNMMQGYWKKPEENRNVFIELDGEVWLRTGDMVKMDEEGYFYFIQRKKEMIKYKGYSVFPVEIEEALYEHPAIKEAAVIGLPDPRVGEKICAVVALKEEYIDRTSADDIISWCRSKLAHYKVPREVKIVDSLPKSAVGKILKRELRDKYMGG
jgi:long-chain acyl-CoA synthetase